MRGDNQQMKKKLKNLLKRSGIFILIAAVFLANVETSALAEILEKDVIYGNNSYDSIEEAVQEATENGDLNPVIRIKSQMELNNKINIPSGRNYTICSNESKLVKIVINENTKRDNVFEVEKNASLKFDNIELCGNYIETQKDDGSKQYETKFGFEKSVFYAQGQIIFSNSLIKGFSIKKELFLVDNTGIELYGNSKIVNTYLDIDAMIAKGKGKSSFKGGNISDIDSGRFAFPIAFKAENVNDTFTLDAVEYKNNAASLIAAYNATIKDCTIVENRSVWDFIYVSNKLNIKNSTISNISSHYRGIVYTKNAEFVNTIFEKLDSSYYDKLIVLDGGKSTFSGVQIKDVSAAEYGCVLLSKTKLKVQRIEDDSLNIYTTENVFENNKGGSVFRVDSASSLELKSAQIINNSAKSGGAVYNEGTTNIYDVRISENVVTDKNKSNTIEVSAGNGINNKGTINLYASANIQDQIMLAKDTVVTVKEDLLYYSETNKLDIVTQETLGTELRKLVSFKTEHSEESAFQAIQKKIFRLSSVKESKNSKISLNGTDICYNYDTISRDLLFVNEKDNPVSGVIYNVSRKYGGEWKDLGYTNPSNEEGRLTISGLYDGEYKMKLVSLPSEVDEPSLAGINLSNFIFKVDTDLNSITTDGKAIQNNLTVRLPKYNPAPIATITASKANVKINEEIEFDASASTDDKEIKKYQWNFGDGTKSNEEKVNHSFLSEGSYTVKLTVSDGNKTDTQSFRVVVKGTLDHQYKLTINIKNTNSGEVIPNAVVGITQINNVSPEKPEENDRGKTKYVYTDENGKVSVYVNENHRYEVVAGKDGYNMKAVHTSVEESAKEIDVFLSNFETIVSDIKVDRISKQEAEKLGVDTSAQENQNFYKHETEVAFSYDREDS